MIYEVHCSAKSNIGLWKEVYPEQEKPGEIVYLVHANDLIKCMKRLDKEGIVYTTTLYGADF